MQTVIVNHSSESDLRTIGDIDSNLGLLCAKLYATVRTGLS